MSPKQLFLLSTVVVTVGSVVWAVATTWGQRPPPSADIRSVKADLVVPPLSSDPPAPGKRVWRKLTSKEDSPLAYVLYLPTNYQPGNKWPVIIELAGNGGYKNKFGDVSEGVPQGSNLGFGISGGRDFIWVCVPFVRDDGEQVATQWWGDAPTYDPQPTVKYCQQVVNEVCGTYDGDPRRVILAGFSRGAIACNFIGLHDDEIAALWCGFVAFSHYDGVRDWQLPDENRGTAIKRLRRLKSRPQFICEESPVQTKKEFISRTQRWIESTGVEGDFTYMSTGFRNHNDAWVLRPSPARDALRQWTKQFLVGR